MQAKWHPNEYMSIVIDGMNTIHSLEIRDLFGSFDYWQHSADYVVSLLYKHLSELYSTILSDK
jgi:hypothetical protein